jgi:hypothetical protein
MPEINSHDLLHREAIKRFLENLGGVADALGDSARLSIQISEGQISRTWAELSHNWYEPGAISYSDVLVISVPTKEHAYALLLSSHRLTNSATGLFSNLRIEWSGGNFGFSHAIPNRQESHYE